MTSRGLLDTSVFVALESGRPAEVDRLPSESAVSVISIAELQTGVLAARDTETRARRLRTLEAAQLLEPLPVDGHAAHEWGRLRFRLHEAGRRAKVNDLWIAAIALARELSIVTQDSDFDVLADLGGPEVIRL